MADDPKEIRISHLVGGLVAIFYFPIYFGLLIIPIDFHIFQRGGEKPPTSHWDDPKNELMGSIDDKTVDF